MVEAPSRADRSIGMAIRLGLDRLRPSPSASLDAQLLLAHVLGVSRPHVIAHGTDSLSVDEIGRYASLIERRSRHEPLAYLRGYIEWYGAEYMVTPDVLIPRPETELLLERAASIARDRRARVVVDVGTGSGVLASQLALCLPGIAVYGTDVSPAALQVSAENLRRLEVDDRVTLLRGHLLTPLTETPDLVVANLPYLSREMMDSRDPDVQHEPILALEGGETGVELYRELLVQIEVHRWRCPLVVEIDPRQSELMRVLVAEVAPARRVEIAADYAGHDRVVIVSDCG